MRILTVIACLVGALLMPAVASATCNPGQYVTGVFGNSCDPCPGGTFSDTIDAVACTPCDPGTNASTSGATSCTPCAGGQIAPDPGAPLCQTCPPDSISNLDGTACLQCADGREPAPSRTVCAPCAPGQVGTGGTCRDCFPGSYTDAAGQVACRGCPRGTAAAGFGATSCPDCPAGTFAPSQGNSTCTPCGPGTFSAVDRSDQCTPCAPGRYSDTSGASSCDACDAGTAAPASASTGCTTCPADTFAPVGAATCTDCPGSTTSPPGSADLSACILTCDPQLYDCDPILPLVSTTPMLPSQQVTFRVEEVPPGAQVVFGVSLTGPGSSCPGSTPACFTLAATTTLPAVTADASGVATRTVTVPATFGGKPVWVQAVASDTGRTGVSPVLVKVVGDSDGDFFLDAVDTCPGVEDPRQIDIDMDGFGAACDCDDLNDSAYPGAPEDVGGDDLDCDGNP